MIFLHTNYLTVYYSLYEINTEALTAGCCEKKVENCNAHCYLQKKMNDEDGKNSNGNSPEIKLKLTEYVVTEYSPGLFPNNSNQYYSNNYLKPVPSSPSEIDHPPQL